MKKKRKQRVMSVLLALLMIVGLIPTNFALKTTNAAVVSTTILDTTGFGTTIVDGTKVLLANSTYSQGVANMTVLEDMSSKAGSQTFTGFACGGYVAGTNSPKDADTTTSSNGSVPASGAVFKFAPAQDCSIVIYFKANSGKNVWFVSNDDANYKPPTATAINQASSTYMSKTYNLISGKTYYFYQNGGKVPVYGIVVNTGTPDVDWSTVVAPVLTSVSQSDSKINVSYNGVIGDLGAEAVVVDMYNGTTKVDTQMNSVKGNSGTVSFSPKASGNYTFKARLTRTGQTDISAVSDANCNFILPLATSSISSITSIGGGKVSLVWDSVAEATSYLVSYSTDGSTFSNPVEVTDTTTTLSGLTVGTKYTFNVVAKRGNDLSSPATKEGTVSSSEQKTWSFSAFGQGADTANNTSSGNVYENTLNIKSLNAKGKLVPANTDGLAYYYTAIDPTQNFVLSATIKVNSWTFSNGQEGFGIMAADAVGKNGDSTVFWNNSYMAGLSKVEYYYNTDTNTVSNTGSKFTMKLGAYSQEKKGVPAGWSGTSLPTTFSTVANPLDFSCVKNGQGTYNIVGNYTNADAPTGTISSPLTEFKLTLIRDNTGYRCIYTAPDGTVTKQTYYDYDGTNLTQIDPNNIYVGFFASRNADISVKDVSLTTSNRATDPPAEQPEITYVNPVQTVTSASQIGIKDYQLVFTTNSDGIATVKDPAGNVILDKVAVTAGTYVTAPVVSLNYGSNKFEVTFDPNDDFAPGTFQKLSSYDPVTFTQTVNYRTFTDNNIWVSPDGTSSGYGTGISPVDVATAVKYVQPGQTIILKEGTYNLSSSVVVARGVDGTADKMINMIADPSASSRPVFDFGKVGTGFTFAGNYWYIKGFDVTNTTDGVRGLQLSGSNCVLDQVNAYHNGNSGIQIARYLSTDNKDLWPANNLVLNCTSYGNADKGYEDADGFAAKLTIGEGNVFRGCIAHNNADDGWDLFAKPESGPIGKVVLENCVTYNNGFLEDGTNAGNGNGFKLGGSSISGQHELRNCISFNNKAKGIDSNSCPDIIVKNSISFNNGASNVALYTNDVANTNFVANGIISFRTTGLSVAETLKPKGTQSATSTAIYNDTNYYWNGTDFSANASGSKVSADWFVNLDTSVAPSRDVDGSINMHGLLQLTDKAPADAGARFVATPSKTFTLASTTDAIKEVINSNSESKVSVVVSGGSIIDSSIFDSIKASGKTIVFDVKDANGVSVATWTFDGSSITKSLPIQLGVVVNATSTNAQKVINNIKIAEKAEVIHFEYSGELPGLAKVAVNVSSKFANGTQLKLYYYNENTGKLEYQNQTVTVANGVAEFSISHCSDYVLVDASLGDAVEVAQNPKTGDTTNAWIYVFFTLTASTVFVASKKKRRVIAK